MLGYEPIFNIRLIGTPDCTVYTNKPLDTKARIMLADNNVHIYSSIWEQYGLKQERTAKEAFYHEFAEFVGLAREWHETEKKPYDIDDVKADFIRTSETEIFKGLTRTKDFVPSQFLILLEFGRRSDWANRETIRAFYDLYNMATGEKLEPFEIAA